MNSSTIFDWKTVSAIGISTIGIILAIKVPREDAKEILVTMVTTVKNKLVYNN